MHETLIPADQVDDFFILRARAFTSKVRRSVSYDVLQNEDLQILEWQLLFSVARFGSCHLAYITRMTSIDAAHGSRAASALENKGMITRCEDPENRRRKLISLTNKGIEVFERVWPNARMAVKKVTDRLNPKDFAELKRLMDLLNQAEEQAPEENQHEKESNIKVDERIAAVA